MQLTGQSADRVRHFFAMPSEWAARIENRSEIVFRREWAIHFSRKRTAKDTRSTSVRKWDDFHRCEGSGKITREGVHFAETDAFQTFQPETGALRMVGEDEIARSFGRPALPQCSVPFV